MSKCPNYPNKSASLFGGDVPPYRFVCCCGHEYLIKDDIEGGYETTCPKCGVKHYLTGIYTSTIVIEHL
jgi:predicted nucleic acid-binding Zn ribbon protein